MFELALRGGRWIRNAIQHAQEKKRPLAEVVIARMRYARERGEHIDGHLALQFWFLVDNAKHASPSLRYLADTQQANATWRVLATKFLQRYEPLSHLRDSSDPRYSSASALAARPEQISADVVAQIKDFYRADYRCLGF